MYIKSIVSAAFISASLFLVTPAWANSSDGHHQHHSDHMKSDGHMMNQEAMGSHMREVMGHGRVNKVMAGHNMINIKHEPIQEMKWPRMNMNFKAQEQVDLSELKPGQEVEFTLLVDKDNNYVIKAITIK